MKKNIYNLGLEDTNISKLELAERIKKYIPNFYIHSASIGEDPDKRDYIVSNEKLEKTMWTPQFNLDRGRVELIKTYNILISDLSSKYRNGFPLGYGNQTQYIL